jgi:hypothetical protein
MTDDDGLDPWWEDLPHDVRAELESMGIRRPYLRAGWMIHP